MPTRTRPIFAIASMPRSGREPCAARPCTSTSRWTKPRCATAILQLRRLRHDRGVGARARRDRLGSDARELLVRDGGEDHVPAQRAAASRRPPRACTPRGSPSCPARHARRAVRLRCEARTGPSCRRRRPCPCARSASASGRHPSRGRPRRHWRGPGEAPSSVVSSPARSHHSATNRASPSSPEPPATTSGLIDSISTSRPASSATSLIRRDPRPTSRLALTQSMSSSSTSRRNPSNNRR